MPVQSANLPTLKPPNSVHGVDQGTPFEGGAPQRQREADQRWQPAGAASCSKTPLPGYGETQLQIWSWTNSTPHLSRLLPVIQVTFCLSLDGRESFRLAPWASRRRRDLLELLDRLTPTIAELSAAIEQEAEKCPEARRLRTHPGVGSLTALAFVLIIGRAERFQCGKQIASYLGLVPSEESSGDRRRLGHITKQGSSLLRFLLVEAAQVTVRSDPEWRSKYFHLAMRRGRKIAKIAMARRLAVRLYWMWRKGWDYEQMKKFGSHAGEPGNRDGVQSNTE